MNEDIDHMIAAVKKGDTESFGLLIETYQQRLFKYACHMLGHAAEAEDVIQDVFLKSYQNLNQYREGTSISAWLYTIAYRECLNKLKKRRLHNQLIGWFMRQEPGNGVHYDDYSVISYMHPLLGRALMQLNAKERHIVLLRVLEEKEFHEIADASGLTVAAARKRYERARNKLRNYLLERGGEGDESIVSV